MDLFSLFRKKKKNTKAVAYKMNIMDFLNKDESDFQCKYYILEVQLAYDFNNEPLIKLICTKVMRNEYTGSEYISESRYGENVRYFFYPATEEYKDYFIMFSRAHRPVQFKSSDFLIRTIEEGQLNKIKQAYIKSCIITGNLTEPEKMMTPMRIS